MSAPQPNAQKEPRKHNKKPQHGDQTSSAVMSSESSIQYTQNTLAAMTGLPMPPETKTEPRKKNNKIQHRGQNSRAATSDHENAHGTITDKSMNVGETKTRPRRKSSAPKKSHPQNDTAAYSDSSTQRPATHHGKTQATPIKNQAYAGPTFHQSPAPSALPIPSFYSRSLPNASPLKSGAAGTQSPSKLIAELDHAKISSGSVEPKRESTPLDFLFDAARKASATPGVESPGHRQCLSSAVDTPVSRSPAAREGDADFPFELDSGDQGSWEGTTPISTPYKDRIEAAKTERTSSAGGKSLDEDDRRAKTAALKQYLWNTAQTPNNFSDNTNPFNAKPAPAQQPQPYYHRSNPNTPYNAPSQNNAQQYFPAMPQGSHAAYYPSPSRAGPTSNLRNVYQPSSDMSMKQTPSNTAEMARISTARETPTRSNLAEIYRTAEKPKDQTSGHRATPSAQQLEDDLRKFLKLDLVGRG